MSKATDARGMLDAEPFSFACRKDGVVCISFNGRPVTVLRGNEAARFLARIDGASTRDAQLAMAKATSHFKHGNEKGR